MKDVMLDLETYGRAVGCPVLSIGAVEFDADGLGREFYVIVELQGQEDIGLKADPNTIAWWRNQSKEARRILDDELLDREILEDALLQFKDFLAPIGLGAVKVWGNGANFDQPILGAAYAACGFELPWKFWNDRCFRTLKALCPHVPMEKAGVQHNALDDAKQQARHAVKLLAMARDAGVEL